MNIIERPLLSSLTTLRIGGRALAEIQLLHKEDCLHLPDVLAKLGGQVHILGGGSNLLIHDGDLPITVLRPFFRCRELYEDQAEIVGEEQGGTRTLIRVGSGIRIPHLLKWCASHGLSGLEGLVGIPSRMGGAIAMNAGAYGCSIAPLLRSLDVFTPEKGLHTVTSKDWTAAYRHFSLHDAPSWHMYVSAVISLPVSTQEEVHETMKANLLRKKNSQPVHEHTAGCIFKNPEGMSAGKLLDEAGMKGKRKGAMFFSPMHANFLVHDTKSAQRGTCADALALIHEARHAVQEKFGINLAMEVREWPLCH